MYKLDKLEVHALAPCDIMRLGQCLLGDTERDREISFLQQRKHTGVSVMPSNEYIHKDFC